MFLPQTKRRTVTFVSFVPFGEFEKTPDAVSVRLEAERWRQQPHKWKDLCGFVLMVERVSNVCSAVASCLFFCFAPPLPLISTISSFWPGVCWTNLIPVPPTGLSFWLTWFLPFNLEHWQDVSLKNSLFFIHIINKNQTFLLFFFFFLLTLFFRPTLQTQTVTTVTFSPPTQTSGQPSPAVYVILPPLLWHQDDPTDPPDHWSPEAGLREQSSWQQCRWYTEQKHEKSLKKKSLSSKKETTLS